MGYDLKNIFNNDESEFNFICIFIGFEGLFVFICEVKFNFLLILKYCMLINIKYNLFDVVFCFVLMMLKVKVLLVEMVDFKVLNLVK